MAHDLHVEAAEQLSRNGARRHAGRGFPGAGPFQHVSNIGAIVLNDAGKVRMAGARPGDKRPRGPGRVSRRLFLGVHRLLPVFPIAISDQQRNGRAERFTGTHAGQHFGLI